MSNNPNLINNPNGNCRLCTEKDHKDNMVACDDCDRWYHIKCARLTRTPTAEETWTCAKCMADQTKWHKQGATAEKQNSPAPTNSNHQLLQEMTNAITNAVQRIKIEPANNTGNDWTIYLKRQALINLPKFDVSAKEWPKFEKKYLKTPLMKEDLPPWKI